MYTSKESMWLNTALIGLVVDRARQARTSCNLLHEGPAACPERNGSTKLPRRQPARSIAIDGRRLASSDDSRRARQPQVLGWILPFRCRRTESFKCAWFLFQYVRVRTTFHDPYICSWQSRSPSCAIHVRPVSRWERRCEYLCMAACMGRDGDTSVGRRARDTRCRLPRRAQLPTYTYTVTHASCSSTPYWTFFFLRIAP